MKKYEFLCKVIQNNYKILTFIKYLSQEIEGNFLILRHDVDSRPNRALRMARLESRLNIKSSYYFRYKKSVFDPKIIKEIDELGHEIGYHYEVLSKTNGDYVRALELFQKELAEFRKLCDIKTICMHGSPLSKYDNRDIWKFSDFRRFGILGEAYLSAGDNLNYFSDTGWSWDPKLKLRDKLKNNFDNFGIYTTEDLIINIKQRKFENIYLLTHPENWVDDIFEWNCMFFKNKIFNSGKKFLRRINKYENC